MDIAKAKIMLQKRRDNMYLWFLRYKKKTDRINKCNKKEFTDEQALKYITSYDKVLRGHMLNIVNDSVCLKHKQNLQVRLVGLWSFK